MNSVFFSASSALCRSPHQLSATAGVVYGLSAVAFQQLFVVARPGSGLQEQSAGTRVAVAVKRETGESWGNSFRGMWAGSRKLLVGQFQQYACISSYPSHTRRQFMEHTESQPHSDEPENEQVHYLQRPENVSRKSVDEFVRENAKNLSSQRSNVEFRNELAGPSARTIRLNNLVNELQIQEIKSGRLNVDLQTPQTITSFAPGYVDKDLELIVGLQTDTPLKCGVKPGTNANNLRKAAAQSQGSTAVADVIAWGDGFLANGKSLECGVYDAMSCEMVDARNCGLVNGFGDGNGRSRLAGDYRKVPLFGLDHLISSKKQELQNSSFSHPLTIDKIQLREHIKEQTNALLQLKTMAAQYGFDIGRPAQDAREAVQWMYFAFLGAIKEHDGPTMCLGKVDSFLDVFIQRDIELGRISEEEAQELIDQFAMKLRMVRQCRAPEYGPLFADENLDASVQIAGWDETLDQPSVTKTTYRFLNSLNNLGPSNSVNISVIWDPRLPNEFKRFCSDSSIFTNGLEYVSNRIQINSNQHQYSKQGAKINLMKFLMLMMNGGQDWITKKQIAPVSAGLSSNIESYQKRLNQTQFQRGSIDNYQQMQKFAKSSSLDEAAQDCNTKNQIASFSSGQSSKLGSYQSTQIQTQFEQNSCENYEQTQNLSLDEAAQDCNSQNQIASFSSEQSFKVESNQSTSKETQFEQDLFEDYERAQNFAEIQRQVEGGMKWLARVCTDIYNISQYMQDKYDYERLDMALNDTNQANSTVFEITGFQEFVNVMSAIKFGKAKLVKNFSGLVIDVETENDNQNIQNNLEIKQIKNWVEDSLQGYLHEADLYKNAQIQLLIRQPQKYLDINQLINQKQSAEEATQKLLCQEKIIQFLDEQFEKYSTRVKVGYFGGDCYGRYL